MENNITGDQLLALFIETRAQFQETREQIANTDKQLVALGKYIKGIARQVGEITDALGRFAEEQVRPRILQMFKAKGIELEETHSHVRIEKDGDFLMEIDLLLVNTIYSVIVEVKNTLRKKDVDDHLDRLNKLQEVANRNIKGTTMYGAVAAMIVTKEVEDYAIKKGFYVIKPKGDNVVISNKSNFVPRTWDVRLVA